MIWQRLEHCVHSPGSISILLMLLTASDHKHLKHPDRYDLTTKVFNIVNQERKSSSEGSIMPALRVLLDTVTKIIIMFCWDQQVDNKLNSWI